MPNNSIAPACLVLYKQAPAKVTAITDKIDILIAGGKSKRVRPKDILLLHPGPVVDPDRLDLQEADLQEAWELLADEACTLEELAELIHGEYTPASAWAAWKRVAEGLYFEGSPDQIVTRPKHLIDADIADQAAKEALQREQQAFYQRLRQGELAEADRGQLAEVEQLALGKSSRSRILDTLGHPQTPVSAHRLLISVGYWGRAENPYPGRLSLSTQDPEADSPPIPEEPRTDLTHLQSYAIDDTGSMDPDDAISLDGDRIWVHVADVAAVVTPDSEIDKEARARGANLYLPEKIVHMLPPALTPRLGLGLEERSPALSFGYRLTAQGEPVELEILTSWIRVDRLSYESADALMESPPFVALKRLADTFRNRRMAQGAINLDLPEVSVKVDAEGEVRIRPLLPLTSRSLVTELMLMTGEAVAAYALAHEIAIPFASQPAVNSPLPESDMAARYAFRRQLKPSQAKTLEAPHAGLGLNSYTRVTSPLRRYLDLVVHQQLRAHLTGGRLLSATEISERIASSALGSGRVRRAERQSNLHWKLIHLQRLGNWRGAGIVVEKQEQRLTLIIPELAMETRLRHAGKVALNDSLQLAAREVDVPDQTAWFRVLS